MNCCGWIRKGFLQLRSNYCGHISPPFLASSSIFNPLPAVRASLTLDCRRRDCWWSGDKGLMSRQHTTLGLNVITKSTFFLSWWRRLPPGQPLRSDSTLQLEGCRSGRHSRKAFNIVRSCAAGQVNDLWEVLVLEGEAKRVKGFAKRRSPPWKTWRKKISKCLSAVDVFAK